MKFHKVRELRCKCKILLKFGQGSLKERLKKDGFFLWFAELISD